MLLLTVLERPVPRYGIHRRSFGYAGSTNGWHGLTWLRLAAVVCTIPKVPNCRYLKTVVDL